MKKHFNQFVFIGILAFSACSSETTENSKDATENNSSASQEQPTDKEITETTEDSDTSIDGYINQIDQLVYDNMMRTDWTSESSIEMFESTEGGELTVYYEGESFGKIKEDHYGEMGMASTEYYFKEGELVFVMETTVHYNAPAYLDDYDPSLDEHVYNSSYFQNGELIKFTDNDNKQTTISNEQMIAEQENILMRFEELLVMIQQ